MPINPAATVTVTVTGRGAGDADGWHAWPRISNALGLREQPTIITALTEASVQGVPDQAKHGTVQEKGVAFSPVLQSAYDLASGGAERVFLVGLGRRRAAGPRWDGSPRPSWASMPKPASKLEPSLEEGQRQRDHLVSDLAQRGVTIRAVDREHVKPGQPVAMTMTPPAGLTS